MHVFEAENQPSVNMVKAACDDRRKFTWPDQAFNQKTRNQSAHAAMPPPFLNKLLIANQYTPLPGGRKCRLN